MTASILRSSVSIIVLLTLAACEESDHLQEQPVVDNTAAVEAYYRDNPDRFVFASPEALPGNLDWQDGSELPTFGDPRAKRGGELILRLRNMQQTLRIAGPDSNGTLRGPLWNANTVNLIDQHPYEDGYIPGLASHWALDPEDTRTVYLRLDPDARWSDGKPFTADDVLFSLYFLLSPHLKAPAINRVYDENISRITRYDALTLAISQTRPSPDPLGLTSTFILAQPDFYREFGEDYVDRYHWRFAPVTGPYTLDVSTIKRGRHITFERLPDWWANDKPFYRHRFNPDRMTWLVMRDDEKAFGAFMSGTFSWAYMNRTSRWYEDGQSEPFANGYIERAWSYHQIPAARTGVYINAMNGELESRELRLGINHSMNYERINDALYRGDRRRIRSFADGTSGYSHPALQARPFDPEQAAAHFAAAGYSERGSDGILVNAAGERLSFVLTVANREDEVTQATILKEEARAAGLELMLDVLDPTAFFTKIFEKRHELALHSWNTGYSALPAFNWEMRGADAGKPSNFNTTNIRDDDLDTLLARWDDVSAPAEAKQISHQIQERIHDFAAWVPGLTRDYERMGYWRWVRWPDYFQVPRYFMFEQSGVFWIDEALQAETQQAINNGVTYPPVTNIYDRWSSAP